MNNKKRSNQEWIDELQLPSPACGSALEELRVILLRGLQAAFRKTYHVDSQSLEDFTQEVLIKILDKLDTFKGDSAFTTWCMKIAVNYTITQLRRKQWKDVSLDNLKSPDNLISPSKLIRFFDGPEKRMMKQEMIGMMNQIIADELTDQQRKVMEAVMIHGMPLDEVAERLHTNRNALYKAMHDARKHLKQILIERGMDKDEILDIFS